MYSLKLFVEFSLNVVVFGLKFNLLNYDLSNILGHLIKLNVRTHYRCNICICVLTVLWILIIFLLLLVILFAILLVVLTLFTYLFIIN